MSQAWFQKIPNDQQVSTRDLLYLLIQDRDDTDLNTVSLQILNRKDVRDVLWAWQLRVTTQVISLQTTQVISLQHNHTAQRTLLTGCPPLPDYQQNFTHHAKQKHLFCTPQAISPSFQTESSKTLPLVRCFKNVCDLVKGTTCTEVWASRRVLCFLIPCTEHPPKSLGGTSEGLIAVLQFTAIPCEMQCVPLKVLLLALKYFPQYSYIKWEIMQLWRQ